MRCGAVRCGAVLSRVAFILRDYLSSGTISELLITAQLRRVRTCTEYEVRNTYRTKQKKRLVTVLI